MFISASSFRRPCAQVFGICFSRSSSFGIFVGVCSLVEKMETLKLMIKHVLKRKNMPWCSLFSRILFCNKPNVFHVSAFSMQSYVARGRSVKKEKKGKKKKEHALALHHSAFGLNKPCSVPSEPLTNAQKRTNVTSGCRISR